MILTVCPNRSNNRDCSIQIAYNDQIPLCTSTSAPDEECRDIENLCVSDPNFAFNLTDADDNAVRFFLSLLLFPARAHPRYFRETESVAERGCQLSP